MHLIWSKYYDVIGDGGRHPDHGLYVVFFVAGKLCLPCKEYTPYTSLPPL